MLKNLDFKITRYSKISGNLYEISSISRNKRSRHICSLVGNVCKPLLTSSLEFIHEHAWTPLQSFQALYNHWVG